ncbi:helix-turn-helix transcriptional regulator [Lachnospiraceae bacterium MD308]|nr:helix-turn-helix transcriptional regulator [Lachnospiraceae bacterium MD308]
MKRSPSEKGLSQSAVAEKLIVSRQAVSRWETGKDSPDINALALQNHHLHR